MVKKVVVLTSGGIDSCVLNAYLDQEREIIPMYEPAYPLIPPYSLLGGKKYKVYPIFFYYGQLSAGHERRAVRQFLDKVNVYESLASMDIDNPYLQIPMTGYGDLPVVTDRDFDKNKHLEWVPHRNFIFLALAAQYASIIGTNILAIGSHREELFPHPDSARKTLTQIEKALTLSDGKEHKWKILTPFVDNMWYKWDVVKWATDQKLPLHLTYSCYQGREKHCGVCRACQDRQKAFEKAGVPDPTEYEV